MQKIYANFANVECENYKGYQYIRVKADFIVYQIADFQIVSISTTNPSIGTIITSSKAGTLTELSWNHLKEFVMSNENYPKLRTCVENHLV